ncbi:MAG: methyltransferase family protein [Burkholderiales bacterium]
MNETFEHSGAWGVAAIVIVVVSWFFYRYFAPKSWREWVASGLVQAFIISLYAEMYGFPLTIYLLVRFSGLDAVDLNASLWSTLLDVGATGMMISMLLGYTLAFVGLGLLIQGWRELYRAHREKRLATEGLYAFVRHPQYTGLFLGLFGEGVVHWPTMFSVALFPVIALAYGCLARNEEKRMLDHFGEEFRAYRQRVPMFIPRWGQWREFASTRRATADEPGQTPL